LYRPNDTGSARLGFAIAKKMLPRAVSRNRVRRVCRESFRLNHEQLGALDIIILARRPAETAGNAELFASLEQHWQRLVTE
jgi:ribonuclease P protein component